MDKEQTREVAIRVEDVYKSFKIPHEVNRSLKSAAINLLKRKSYTVHDAAKGISFEVKQGEFLGIIGRNGCGKSTMLKMLAGIYTPNKGKIYVNGRLSPFLELGVGFNPELTARDNVYLNGTMLGLSRKEIDEKFDEIIDFAELREFVDQKLKNYSSGMQVRLAFSVAVQAHAEILLIDEVLAVGDTNFQRKCFNIFHDLKKAGKTIIFVSHSMDTVRKFCDRVILLNEGKILIDGNPEKATYEYDLLNLESANKTDNADKGNEWGSKEMEITGIQAVREGAKIKPVFKRDEPIELEFEVKNNTNKVRTGNLSVGFYSENFRCFDTSTYFDNKNFRVKPKKNKKIKVRLLPPNFLTGDYSLNFLLFENEPTEVFHGTSGALNLIVLGKKEPLGVSDIKYEWEVDEK